MDIYTQLYNGLQEIGLPDTLAGYSILYHKAVPICDEVNTYDDKECGDCLSLEKEIQDTNQAEIVVNDEYGITDKLQQMKYIVTLLPRVVQRGLFDV